MTGDPVGTAIGTLERTLHGPRRVRAELVREVRDGLEDAVEAHREAGLGDEDAQRSALADFGDVREVAAALQEELTAAYGLRSAARMAVAFPALVLLWDTLWLTDPMPGAGPLTSFTAWLASAIDVVAFASAAACLIAVVLLWAGARRRLPSARVTRSVGLLGLCTLAATGGLSLVMNVLDTSHEAGLYAHPAVLAVMTANVCVAAWVSVSGRRCLRLGRLAHVRSGQERGGERVVGH